MIFKHQVLMLFFITVSKVIIRVMPLIFKRKEVQAVIVNGKETVINEGVTVSEFLAAEGYNQMRVAVEYNGCIIKRSEYDDTVLCNEDKLEIVQFVGGG